MDESEEFGGANRSVKLSIIHMKNNHNNIYTSNFLVNFQKISAPIVDLAFKH